MTQELGLPVSDVHKILVRSPKLLSYGVESMREKQCYLEEGLQLGANDVSGMNRAPDERSVMWRPIAVGIACKCKCWGHHCVVPCILFNVQPEAASATFSLWLRLFMPVQVSSLVSRCPQLLGYRVDAMESKVVFLEKVGEKESTIPVLVRLTQCNKSNATGSEPSTSLGSFKLLFVTILYRLIPFRRN